MDKQTDTTPGTAAAPVETLKRRADFLRIRGGNRWSCGAFVIETKQRNTGKVGGDVNAPAAACGSRIGYTVTKRIGNAVIRNRVKRRLRAAVASLEPNELRADCDYVLIARPGALKRAFVDLTNDLRAGLASIHRPKRHN